MREIRSLRLIIADVSKNYLFIYLGKGIGLKIGLGLRGMKFV